MSLIVENISYTYMQGTPYERRALDGVSLKVDKGEFVAMIGHSGSGKSTLVQHIAGLLQPMSGRVLIDGTDLAGKSKESRLIRHKAGLVFQYPEHQLFAETVFADVAFGPRNFGIAEDEVAERVKNALDFVHMPLDEFGARSPFQLSGGQMRKVAIAGVVAMQPDYLILDEPTAGFDPRARDSFYEELRALYQKSGMTVILVTHSMEEATELASRLLVMSGGKIALDGTPEHIFLEGRDMLKRVGVDVPAIVSLTECLFRHGLKVSAGLSQDKLVQELLKLLPSGGRHVQ